MIKSTVSGADESKKALKDLIEGMEAPYVTVGIHEDSPAPEGDINMATLGAIQHFGAGSIPARPWLDAGVESGSAEYVQVIESGLEGEEDPEKIMNMLGVIAVGKVQEFITQLKSPPNAESTVRRKKSANPLIDTGAMRASVNYKLDKAKPEEGL